MTEQHNGEVMAALLDALTLVQGQLEEIGESNRRIEATQAEIMTELKALVDGNAQYPDGRRLLAQMAEDRTATRSELARVAQVAGLAHAAAMGNGAPLPAAVTDDALLELYVFTRPADRDSTDRASIEWRRLSKEARSADLVEALRHQYQPSPTDTRETRILRYRLAAISREELEGRGVTPPPPPASTRAHDRSPNAAQSKSEELARLWGGGESLALFAEPELAGTLDLFEAAERSGQGMPEEQLSADLAELHRVLGERIAAGERSSVDMIRSEPDEGRGAENQPGIDR